MVIWGRSLSISTLKNEYTMSGRIVEFEINEFSYNFILSEFSVFEFKEKFLQNF